MVEFFERFLGCDKANNTYRLYFLDDLWVVLEQNNRGGTFMTGFLTQDKAIDYLDMVGCDISELRPPDPLYEALMNDW